MIRRAEILAFLDERLDPDRYKDSCPNGIQVYGCEAIEKVATCVSVSEDFFRQAARENAQLLIVHHGLFWEGSERVVDPILAGRLRVLLENELNLIAYHLPLDAHPEMGNNAGLAAVVRLQNLDFDFGHYKGLPIGCVGDLPVSLSLGNLSKQLADGVGGEPIVLDTGPSNCSRVGIVSGGAGDVPFLLEASAKGCDTYVTGAIFEQAVAVARETGINVVALGHYNSEKLGVRSIGDAIGEHFGLRVVHLDVPNPL